MDLEFGFSQAHSEVMQATLACGFLAHRPIALNFLLDTKAHTDTIWTKNYKNYTRSPTDTNEFGWVYNYT